MIPRVIVVFALIVFVLSACNRASDGQVQPQAKLWPPPAVCDDSAPPSAPEAKARFGSTTGVLCRTPDMNCYGVGVVWGPRAVEGEMLLPGDVFSISQATPGYTKNQYEVVRHEPSRTRARLIESRGDEILMAGDASTATTSGTRVRCGIAVYEIRPDGWYVEGKIVHGFGQSASQK